MADISKIDMERINGLIDKLEEVTDKLNSMKYVVETWNEGTEWYRVWSDGWIEQGGFLGTNTIKTETKTIHKAFSNTNYTICIAIRNDSNSVNLRVSIVNNHQITFSRSGSYNATGWWYACGY